MTDAPKTIAEMREAAAVECDNCPDMHWGPWLAKRVRAIPLPADDAEMVERGAKALARLYKLEDFAPFYEDAKAVLSAMRGEP